MRRIELTDTFMSRGTVRIVDEEGFLIILSVENISRIVVEEKNAVIVVCDPVDWFIVEINEDLVHLVEYLYAEDLSHLLKPTLTKSDQVIADIKIICDSYYK